MDWKTYSEDQLLQSFGALAEELESIVEKLRPDQRDYPGRRIGLARQEEEGAREREPGRLFRPAALKLANIARVVAKNLQENGLPVDAAAVANLSFEIFRGFQHTKYVADLCETIHLYAETAFSPASISLATAAASLSETLKTVIPSMRDSVELAALTGLADAFDNQLRQLVETDRVTEIQEFLSNNLQSLIVLATRVSGRDDSLRFWKEEAMRFAPELLELLADQQVPGATETTPGNLPQEDVDALRRAVQEVGYQRVLTLLERHQSALRTALHTLLDRDQSNIVDPPRTIKDREPRVVAAFDAAMKQLAHDPTRALRSLEEAYRFSPTNARVMEWLGTIFLRQTPPNLLRAREYFEGLPSRWSSFTRDWNLSGIYRRLGGDERQRAFELLRTSFLDEPRTSTLTQSLSLALELEHGEYLVSHLREFVAFEAAALGFILAHRSNDRAAQDVYLLQLESYLSEGVPTLPPLSHVLQLEEVQRLKDLFVVRRLIEAGIIHFEDRYRRYRQLASHEDVLFGALVDLLETAARFERALELQQRRLENDFKNPAIPEWRHIANVQQLFRYCSSHRLTAGGVDLLHWASAHNVNLTKEQRTHWQRVFGVATPEQERSAVEDPSPAAVPQDDARVGEEPQGQIDGAPERPPLRTRPGISAQAATEASNILLTANPQLAKLRTSGAVLEHKDLVQRCFWAVETLVGDASRVLISHLDQMLTILDEFQREQELDGRRQLSTQLLQLQRQVEDKQIGVQDRNIAEYLSGVTSAVRSAVYDAASRVKTLPVLRPRILNTFVTSREDRATTLVVEIANESDLPVQSVEVSLRLGTGTFTLTAEESTAQIPDGILPKGKRVVCFRLRKKPGVSGRRETFLLAGTYAAEGMKRLPLFEDAETLDLPIQDFKSLTGAEGEVHNPYIAVGAVPFERPENFHGRDGLLTRIRGSVAGQESREALFINGIRRIGKTSLLNMLEGDPPPGLLPVKIRLDSMNPQSTGLFWYSVASLISTHVAQSGSLPLDSLDLQDAERMTFFKEHPEIAFPRFLDEIAPHVGQLKLFLMFDEFQIVTEAIQRARAEGTIERLNVSLLDMIRGYLEDRRFLALFTGSLLFTEIREHVPDYNRLWGSLKSIDAGFVDADAVARILKLPASRYKIVYCEEAITRAFDYTQGYPWFVQMIGTEIVKILNAEDRLVVAPQDVDAAAAELVGQDYNFDGYWWEHQRFEPRFDGPILKAILDLQQKEWTGLPVAAVVEAARRDALAPEATNQRIAKLRQYHILDRSPAGHYRIKALILERWLQTKRAEGNGSLPFDIGQRKRPVKEAAILIDHENLWFSLANLRDKATDRPAFISQTSIETLVSSLRDHALKYGPLTSERSLAVADWHNPREIGPQRHQQVYRTWGFETPLPIRRGREVADHELRDRVSKLQRSHPETDVYVLVHGDGDLSGMAEALMDEGKEVVVWALRTNLHGIYDALKRRGLRLEYIEDILSLPEF